MTSHWKGGTVVLMTEDPPKVECSPSCIPHMHLHTSSACADSVEEVPC